MFSLKYEPAEGDLAQLISSFYCFSYAGENLRELERADRPQFRFSLGNRGQYEFHNGHVRKSYPVTILGPTTGPVTSVARNNQIIVGWGMHAAGWAAMMGKDAEKWVDDAHDASEIFGDSILELHRNLIDCWPDTDGIFTLLKNAATEIFSDQKKAPYELIAIVDDWLANSCDHDIAALVQKSGLSQRQLERSVKRYYGAPPKMLSRKFRALRTAQILSSGDNLDNSDLALSFYDQSHQLRDVKQFTGLTPGQLRAGKGLLTKATMDGRKALKGKVSKLVSDS